MTSNRHFSHTPLRSSVSRARTRALLVERDGDRCCFCGREPTTIDHLTPLARGGTSDVYNLGLACEPCNREKGTMTEAEFRASKLKGDEAPSEQGK